MGNDTTAELMQIITDLRAEIAKERVARENHYASRELELSTMQANLDKHRAAVHNIQNSFKDNMIRMLDDVRKVVESAL